MVKIEFSSDLPKMISVAFSLLLFPFLKMVALKLLLSAIGSSNSDSILVAFLQIYIR